MSHNVRGHYLSKLSGWRRIALGTWRSANDPTIYGTLDVDASKALEYVAALRKATGERVTVTHLITKALADTLAKHPECNAYVRMGRIYEREQIDVFVLVAVPPEDRTHDQGADLSGVKIVKADTKSVLEIARETRKGARQVRTGKDPAFHTAKKLLRGLPGPVVRLGLALMTWLQYELNLDLSKLSIPRDSFGAALVTSVGMMGLKHAFPPLIPMTRLTGLIAIGKIEETPVAEGGKVVIRPVLPLTGTFDHRIIDGYQAGRIAKTFVEILNDPEKHLGPVSIARPESESDSDCA